MVTVKTDGDFIRVGLPMTAHEIIEILPDKKWLPASSEWQFPNRGMVAWSLFQQFRKRFDAADIHADSVFMEWVNLFDEIANRDDDPVSRFSFKTQPWEHQRRAFNKAFPLLSNGQGCILDCHMGTGKTWLAINLIQALQQSAGDCGRVLVIGPKAVADYVWAEEFRKHGDGAFQIETLSGSAVKRSAKVKGLARLSNPVVIICNSDSIWREPLAAAILNDFKPGAIIADECHRAKDSAGKYGKFLGMKLGSVKYRMGLTGTLMPHSPLDLFSQLRFINRDIYGRSKMHFDSQYVIYDTSNKYRRVAGWRNSSTLRERLDWVRIRITEADASIDMPEEIVMQRHCELPPDARRLYDDARKSLVLRLSEVSNEPDVALQILPALLKCQQIANGFVKGAESLAPVHDSKVKLFVDTLNEMPPAEPVLVFCRFKHDIEMVRAAIREHFNDDPAVLSGDESTLDKWQRKECRFLICQLQSGGVGLDLTRASWAIYFSLDFNWANWEQSKARIRRPGQVNSHCRYIALTTAGTIDQHIFQTLRKRGDYIRAILDGEGESSGKPN